MKPSRSILLVSILSCLVMDYALGGTAKLNKNIKITVQENEYIVSANFKDQRLIRTLKEIAKKAPLIISAATDDTLISAKFCQFPLKKALARLLQDSNYVLIREPNQPSDKPSHIHKLVLLSPSKESSNSKTQVSDSSPAISVESDEYLLSDLENHDHSVRQEALSRISESDKLEHMSLLANIMIHDQSELVRAAAIEAMSTIEGSQILDRLKDALRDPSELVRDAAKKALSSMDMQPTDRDTLVETYYNEQQEFDDPAAIDASHLIN